MHMQMMAHYLFQLLKRLQFVFSIPLILYLMKLLVPRPFAKLISLYKERFYIKETFP